MSAATTLQDELWLDPIPEMLHAQAIEAFEAGDAIGFLCLASNEDGLALVSRNWIRLLKRGIYEVALLHAFIATRTNNAGVPSSALESLFSWADRAKLLAAGDPLPGPGPFTVYRGVAGRRQYRRERGFSWTTSLSRAQWFADRYSELPDPAVLQVEVALRHVLAYSNDREEEEFIVRLPRNARPRRVNDAIATVGGH